jgi:hypothetical protein
LGENTAIAGVGMLIALVVYLAALPTLPIDELHKANDLYGT